jgi:hypothetical protein
MKTKMRLLSLIVLSMVMTLAFAQQMQAQGQRVQRTPEEIAKTQTEWMKTDLKLNEATQTKVYDVILKYAKQSSEERKKLMAAGDREAMRAKMTEITAARDKELKIILGDKTFELFKTKEAERRQAMMQQRQN